MKNIVQNQNLWHTTWFTGKTYCISINWYYWHNQFNSRHPLMVYLH